MTDPERWLFVGVLKINTHGLQDIFMDGGGKIGV
jgi:hypothetical protein